MSIKNEFYIKKVSYSDAINMVVKNHYLHRKCPCSFAFGLFRYSDNLMYGVIIYGTPSSAPLRMGICGISEKNNVIELTRLWISDNTPKNVESYLIGNTIPLVDKEIIVSFAEIDQGHIGVVYQATNWIYTGLSAKRTNWKIEGIEKHCQTIADKYTSSQVREKYGDLFSLQERPRKHRYVYFNASKTRKKQLIKLLKYKPLPYPR